MQQLFAVIRTRGPAWQDSRSMESQADWASHASFMNSLAKEGFVILGGPLEGSPDVLLVIGAKTPDEFVPVWRRILGRAGIYSTSPGSHPGRCGWDLSSPRNDQEDL